MKTAGFMFISKNKALSLTIGVQAVKITAKPGTAPCTFVLLIASDQRSVIWEIPKSLYHCCCLQYKGVDCQHRRMYTS